MAYQVWSYEGEPFLIWSGNDFPEEYTTIPPDDGMYYPIYFDPKEQKWHESEEHNKEDNHEEDNQEDVEESDNYTPNPSEIMLAKAQMQVTKTANQLVKSQKELANMGLEMAKKEKRLVESELSHAETLKELASKEERLKEIEQEQAKLMLEITNMKKGE